MSITYQNESSHERPRATFVIRFSLSVVDLTQRYRSPLQLRSDGKNTETYAMEIQQAPWRASWTEFTGDSRIVKITKKMPLNSHTRRVQGWPSITSCFEYKSILCEVTLLRRVIPPNFFDMVLSGTLNHIALSQCADQYDGLPRTSCERQRNCLRLAR